MHYQSPAQPVSLSALDAPGRQRVIAAGITEAVAMASDQYVCHNLMAVVCRHPPKFQIGFPPFLENTVVFNLRGSARLSGRITRQFALQPWISGNLAILPQGEPIRLEWDCAHDIVALLPAPGLLTGLSAEVNDAAPGRVELIERISHQDPLLYQLGLGLLGELRANVPAGDLYLDALTRTLILHLLRFHAAWPIVASPYRGVLTRARLRHVLDYIQHHLAENLSVERIAQEAQLSPYHFARLFKQSTGQPVHRYVLEQRLSLAQQMLRSTTLSLSEVALGAGFHDQSHLSRHFKRHYGVTPGQFVLLHMNVQSGRMNVQDPDA